MAKKVIPVDYTSADFEKIKKDLVNYTKKYYPNTYKDFNEASFGSLMTDLVSYVGDSLAFYLDYNANESFLDTSLEYDHILAHARQMGYKHSPVRSSVGEVDIYVPVPAGDNQVAPDIRYLPKMQRGSTFATTGGTVFTLVEDIEFYSGDVEVVGDEVSADGARTTYYILKAKGKVISGENRQTIIETGDYKRFLKLPIPGENICEVVSVVDSSGHEYYEVDYLSQNVVYRPVINRNFATIDNSAPAIMKAFPVTRRFVVERSGQEVSLVFGYGSEADLKNNVVADPSEIVLNVMGKNYISDISFDPAKLLSTDKFGIVPVNTDLTVTYRVNNEDNVNAAAGSIVRIASPILEFRNPQNLESAKISYITSNLEVFNERPINGDLTIATTEEIKHRAYGMFATQGRAVTLQDYISAAYAMPASFGAVKRAAIYRDDNDYTRNMNMYVMSEDSSGLLQKSSQVLKENLKTWLNSIRMVNDSLDIFDATVINLGIEFEVLGQQDVSGTEVFNLAKEEIFESLNEVRPEIGEPFQIIEIFKILKDIPEVLDVINVKIVAKSGTGYSSFAINVEDNLSPEGRMLYIPHNCIWEIKFKSDIVGSVR